MHLQALSLKPLQQIVGKYTFWFQTPWFHSPFLQTEKGLKRQMLIERPKSKMLI